MFRMGAPLPQEGRESGYKVEEGFALVVITLFLKIALLLGCIVDNLKSDCS